jgi:hypothetical protein
MKNLIVSSLAAFTLIAVSAEACEEHKHGLKGARKSGEITKEEAKSLREERKKMRDLKEAAKADGKISEEERAQLKAARKDFLAKAKELKENNVKSEAVEE